MAKTKAKKLVDTVEWFHEIEQGSAEWHDLHIGVPTASSFASVLAAGEGKMRSSYMRQVAAEAITGERIETYKSADMMRGLAMEDEARQHFMRSRFCRLERCGFVRRTVVTAIGTKFVVGCSPDSLIDDDGVLEIKTMRPDLLIELLDKGAAGFPTEHRAQCQGSMWVTGRKYVHLTIFYRGMPSADFVINRDDEYIKNLSNEVERFSFEVRKLIERTKARGV
jgi:hypothetical protein